MKKWEIEPISTPLTTNSFSDPTFKRSHAWVVDKINQL